MQCFPNSPALQCPSTAEVVYGRNTIAIFLGSETSHAASNSGKSRGWQALLNLCFSCTRAVPATPSLQLLFGAEKWAAYVALTKWLVMPWGILCEQTTLQHEVCRWSLEQKHFKMFGGWYLFTLQLKKNISKPLSLKQKESMKHSIVRRLQHMPLTCIKSLKFSRYSSLINWFLSRIKVCASALQDKVGPSFCKPWFDQLIIEPTGETDRQFKS